MRLLFDDGIALELYALSYQTSATGEMANGGKEQKNTSYHLSLSMRLLWRETA